MKITIDPRQPNAEEQVRQIVFARLRGDKEWCQRDGSGEGFERYVEYVAPNEMARRYDRDRLVFLAQEVFWQLVGECILAPGLNPNNLDLPWFHITEYGKQLLESTEPQPYDASGYMRNLLERVPNADPTLVAYLAEGLDTFRKGNFVASAVMLGIGAERVFLLLCEAIVGGLADPSEKTKFQKILDRFPMKPKLDWVQNKFQETQKNGPRGFPDNATIMIGTIYDLMRNQRNELGHPRETPPRMKREDVFANLQVFPRYYEIAEEIRNLLKTTTI